MKSSSLVVTCLLVPISLFALQASAQARVQASTDDALLAALSKKQETLESLLTQIESNEIALYTFFNAINSSDDDDIHCVKRVDDKLERERQICEPAFLEKIREENRRVIEAESMKDAGLFGRLRETFFGPWELTDEQVRARAAEPLARLPQEIETLATSNPTFLSMLETVGQLQKQFLALSEASKRKDPAFMWQNEPGYRNAQLQHRPAASPKPWFSAPPPGYTQPQINFGYRDSPRR